jgi:hypothetical protein
MHGQCYCQGLGQSPSDGLRQGHGLGDVSGLDKEFRLRSGALKSGSLQR